MRSNTTAVIGLVIGLIGAILLGLFVSRASDGSSTDEQAVVNVLVAAADIAANTDAAILDASLVETREIPVTIRPVTAVTDVSTLGGQRTLRPIGVGEILTSTQFGTAGPTAGGLVVDEGYEAMSVEAALAPGVEGYITPGSKVNIYATLTAAETDPTTGAAAGSNPFTQLVLGHVRVLAVTRGALNGQATTAGEGAPSQIVLLLEVRPEEVPVMIYAQQQGSLWYSIVNEDDPAPSVVRVQLPDLEPATREASIAAAIQLQDQREAERAVEEASGGSDSGNATATDAPSPTEASAQ